MKNHVSIFSGEDHKPVSAALCGTIMESSKEMNFKLFAKDKFKLFLLIVYVLFIESFFLALILSPFLMSSKSDYLYSVLIGIPVFTALFVWYKLILESWVFLIIALLKSLKERTKITVKVLIQSRIIMAVVFFAITLISLLFERDSLLEIVGGSILLPLIYIIHFTIPYLFFKKHLIKIHSKYIDNI